MKIILYVVDVILRGVIDFWIYFFDMDVFVLVFRCYLSLCRIILFIIGIGKNY